MKTTSPSPVTIDELQGPLAVHPDWLVYADTALRCGRPLSGPRELDPSRSGNIGIIRLWGPIWHRQGAGLDYFGGTSLLRFAETLRDFGDSPAVNSIIIDVDSPGGTVAGLLEAADVVRSVASRKTVACISNTMMASAAYWLSSQASEVWCSPSGEVGSIGVYSLHLDYSGQLAQQGVSATFVHAGEHKVEGNPLQPLSDEAKKEMQASVDHYYAAFLRAVANGRRSTVSKVKTDFGGGRMMRPDKARAVGAIDGVATMDYLVANIATPLRQRQAAQRRQAHIAMAEEIREIEGARKVYHHSPSREERARELRRLERSLIR